MAYFDFEIKKHVYKGEMQALTHFCMQLVAILQWLRRIVTVACVSALSLSLLSKNGLALVSHLYMHVFQFQNRNTPLHFSRMITVLDNKLF